METETLIIPVERDERLGVLERAVELLRAGQPVAFPTETLYALGADGLNPEAVERVFEAKARPAEKGMILAVASVEQVAELVEEVPPPAAALMARFWPGPLTLVLRARTHVSRVVTGGGDTVAVRYSGHPVVTALVQALGRPVVVPSANLAGHPPPRTAAEVLRDLEGRIPLVLDGGPTASSVPSTIVDVSGPEPRVLREGAISAAAILEGLG